MLNEYLQLKLHRPERHAIRNLLGLLEARIENYQQALGYFTQVLSEDPTNLNAIANCRSLANILHRFSESNECNEQLRLLLRSSVNLDYVRRNARCLAEQAYAYAFDIVDDGIGCERYIRSHQLYFKALELAGNYVNVEEKQDWELADAIVCRKIYSFKYKNAESEANYARYLETSLRHFYLVLQHGDVHMKSECWRHMGEIFGIQLFSSRNYSDRARLVSTRTFNHTLIDRFDELKKQWNFCLEIQNSFPDWHFWSVLMMSTEPCGSLKIQLRLTVLAAIGVHYSFVERFVSKHIEINCIRMNIAAN